MTQSKSASRALYALAVCAVATPTLWVGMVGIGFYYFLTDQAIPSTVDRIQYCMYIGAGVCVLMTVALLICVVVLSVRSHRATRPQP